MKSNGSLHSRKKSAIRTVYYKIKLNVSCEIEGFIETHLCKLRGTLQSRVLGVLCDLIKNVKSLLRGTKSDSCGTLSVQICGCGYVCDVIYIGWT